MVIELTVRKIGDAAVGRVKTATIPVIQPGKFVKIPIDATTILPNAVNLKDTTFKVVADSSNINGVNCKCCVQKISGGDSLSLPW
jgi:hypothetical protein